MQQLLWLKKIHFFFNFHNQLKHLKLRKFCFNCIYNSIVMSRNVTFYLFFCWNRDTLFALFLNDYYRRSHMGSVTQFWPWNPSAIFWVLWTFRNISRVNNLAQLPHGIFYGHFNFSTVVNFWKIWENKYFTVFYLYWWCRMFQGLW